MPGDGAPPRPPGERRDGADGRIPRALAPEPGEGSGGPPRLRAPRCARRLLVVAFHPVLLVPEALVTRLDPRRQRREMDPHHDVVGWGGGYPSEYATVEKVTCLAAGHGLSRVRIKGASAPTGRNEFVFLKSGTLPATSGAGRTAAEGFR